MRAAAGYFPASLFVRIDAVATNADAVPVCPNVPLIVIRSRALYSVLNSSPITYHGSGRLTGDLSMRLIGGVQRIPLFLSPIRSMFCTDSPSLCTIAGLCVMIPFMIH